MDFVLFAKANNREIQALDECLESYYQWSGQSVNRDKSGLIFSKRQIKLKLRMKIVQQIAMYLGAPLFSSRSRCKDFKYLQERLESKLLGQRCKALSWAGHNTLIKSIAQSLPTYAFSSFDVLVTVCDKFDTSRRLFWWNLNKTLSHSLAWKAWYLLCLLKYQGGLGFKKSKKFNDAFLEKLAWKVISKRESICIQALRSKYKVRDDWLKANLIQNASPTWKAIER